MYPIESFVHLHWTFEQGVEVDPAHPMVELRPDLFTPKPNKPKKEAD